MKIIRLNDFSIKESVQGDKIYYNGRNIGSRPYSGNYIYITDNVEYAKQYSDGKIIYRYMLGFPEDKIFSLRNKTHQGILQKSIDSNAYNAIIKASGAGNEMDWAASAYIENDEHEDADSLLASLGFLGVKLKERPDADSILIFNQDNLKQLSPIDISPVKPS